MTPYDSSTNSDNELTAFESSSANQTFDADGNQLTSSTGFTYEYNGWDEMVSSTTSSTTTQYTYNALGQRITIGSGSTMQYQYYSASGQVIETDTVADGTGSAISQYVWGLAYVNDLLVRDDNSTSGSYGGGLSSLGRRMFAIDDANFDVTGLASTSAIVQQRFEYTPYGVRTAMTASYVGTTDGYSFEVGFQGGVIDPSTGLIRFGVRDYDPVTGRWTEPEPFGSAYVDGPNLYEFAQASPTSWQDFSGFDAHRPFPPDNIKVINPGVILSNGMGELNGRPFSVTLRNNVTIHKHDWSDDGNISLTASGERLCRCHWIQFMQLTATIKDGALYTGSARVFFQGYRRFNDTKYYVDQITGSAYAGSGGYEITPSGSVTYFDKPGVYKRLLLYSTVKTITRRFEDYLVCDGHVKYELDWSQTSQLNNGAIETTTEAGFSGPQEYLPSDLWQDGAFSGAGTTTPTNTIPYARYGFKNPIVDTPPLDYGVMF